MNKDIARKIVAIVSMSRKDGQDLTLQDFVRVLSYMRKDMSEDEVIKFVNKAIEDKILVQSGDKLKPSFTVSGIKVPLDFSIDLNALYTDVEKPLIERMFEYVSASGKLTREEAAIRAKKLNDKMKYLDYEIALLAILTEESLDVRHFIRELEGQ